MNKNRKIINLAIFIVITILTKTGCPTPYNERADKHYYNLFKDKELYYDDRFLEIEKNIQSIAEWIYHNIEYRGGDSNETKSVKNPKQTLEDGYGICGDYAVLFQNIAYYVLGIKMDIVLVDIYDRKIINGGNANHAELYYSELHHDGYNYDVYSGLKFPLGTKIKFLYKFDTVFPETKR